MLENEVLENSFSFSEIGIFWIFSFWALPAAPALKLGGLARILVPYQTRAERLLILAIGVDFFFFSLRPQRCTLW